MTRIKRGTTSRKRHKKVLSRTKGYRMTKSRLIKVAKEADLHAGQYAYVGRKQKKREMRRLWITRISEALKKREFHYNTFIHNLNEKNITLNRKMLAFLASKHPSVFDDVVKKANK